MYIIFLRFSDNKPAAKDHMAAHNAWIAKGVADGVFLVVGSLQPQQGGAIIAHAEDLEAIEQRVAADPFVQENVVAPEILEISVNTTAESMRFLKDDQAA
ncbi:YciI family protein [uncultured Roseobacter sp.]|uniref:YciI family protein n=1 Tax=uncultured Roseobacter sp. TaxID=114847 RepID=UPI0026197D54|nr:YciI family protein [uncultured Roseobacter sp.]